MKRGTPGHWKIQNLALDLKIEPYAAVGLCCCMWEWVGNSLMTGNIGKADDAVIARQIGWTKKPSILIEALVKNGLLDPHPEHRLIVHDWSTHADDGVHTYLVRRGLRFADGKAPRWRHLNSEERKQAEAFYGVATSPPHSERGENVATPHDGHISKADGTERVGTDRNGSPYRSPKGDCDGTKKPPKLIPAYSPAFEAFWARYPTTRRTNKPGAWKIWERDQLERPQQPGQPRLLDLVMRSLEQHRNCEQWQDGYVPLPTTWLNQKRWSTDPPTRERSE